MEEYGLDGLAASAESVLAGLGPLAVQLARLAGEASRAVTLDAIEGVVAGQGQDLLRGLVQLALDGQAEREVRLAQVTGDRRGAAGPRRAGSCPAGGDAAGCGGGAADRTTGPGSRGVPSLFPRDAVLNLPPWGIRGVCSGWRRCSAGPCRMSRRTSSCWPRPGSVSASGSWSRSPWRRPRTRSGFTRTGPGTPPPSRRPGSRGRACRRWRSPPMARAWRCSAGPPPPRHGPGAEGADLRQAGRDRGEERAQADGRDRGVLRRSA